MTDTKPTPTASPLTDLAAKIKAEHQEVVTATNGIVLHAIRAGELLLTAKQSVTEHGEWLKWLKIYCEFEERTAQRYMRLAKNKEELKALSNPTRLSDLSLSKAYRLLVGEPSKRKGGGNDSDRYDKWQEKLIESLKKLDAATAEAAAVKTIQQITEIVSTKTGTRWKP